MGLLDDTPQTRAGDDAPETDPPTTGRVADLSARALSVDVAGETVELEAPETSQPDDEGTWLTGTDSYGRPRGVDALEARQIVQTAAMQSITNGIADQILGGTLVFEDDEGVYEDLSSAEQRTADQLKTILRDVITGPHLQRESLDDIVVAVVEDMLGPGNGYWQPIAPADGSLPVAALSTLDPLTIRRNVDEHGVFGDPPYWQATASFSDVATGTVGAVEPVELGHEDVIEFSYPRGVRSYKFYPQGAAWQVKEWLEILANSTTHHNRFYADNEHASGLLQIINGSQNTIDNIRDQIQEASGDPRKIAVAGGESAANWIEMGGTAVNLDLIQEQQWFFELCLGSLGLGKAEVGMIEDVNRANGKIEADRVYKRVAGPFIDQFEEAMLEIARQFDPFRELGEPFTPTIAHSDPRAEQAKHEQVVSDYNDGLLSLQEALRRLDNDDLAADDDRFEITVAGETINYGAHPRWVVERLLTAAVGDVDVDTALSDEDDGDADGQTLALGAGGAARTNGDGHGNGGQ